MFRRQLDGVLERAASVFLDSVGIRDHELRQTCLALTKVREDLPISDPQVIYRGSALAGCQNHGRSSRQG